MAVLLGYVLEPLPQDHLKHWILQAALAKGLGSLSYPFFSWVLILSPDPIVLGMGHRQDRHPRRHRWLSLSGSPPFAQPSPRHHDRELRPPVATATHSHVSPTLPAHGLPPMHQLWPDEDLPALLPPSFRVSVLRYRTVRLRRRD
jgi:hypothetical protein